jgi:YidC/Oxa1 family membrane protein insertase
LNLILLTKSNTFLIGWVASLFGYVMEFIYNVTYSVFGIENIGLAIIVFTMLVNIAMIPLLMKQQKSMKINNIIQPEIQAIQKKYKGKDDQRSQIRMQAETQAVYDKYGTSMTGGCLTSLISFPIMLGLYQIILNMPAYIGTFRNYFTNVAAKIQEQSGFVESLTELAASRGISGDLTQTNILVDLMYKFSGEDWQTLEGIFPSIQNVIAENAAKISEVLSFGPINLMESPGFRISWAILIPILAGLTQWFSTKLMTPASANRNREDDPMGSSMKMMNTIFPLMSVFFCFTFPAYIGIYWVANSAFRIPIQFFINKQVDKADTNEIIRQNIEKKNKKRAKKGLPPLSEKTVEKNIEDLERKYQMSGMSGSQTSSRRSSMRAKADAGKQVNNTEYYNSRAAKPGSMAAKANMVKEYNEKNKK